MDWIFDNLQLIIVIAGTIAYWINQRAREKAGQEADYDEDGIPENRPARRDEAQSRELQAPPAREGFDPDQEERARRIREEIQRRIAERRGQAGAPPPMPAPPRLDPFRPVFQEDAPPSPPPLVREVVVHAEREDESAMARQRQLAEQLERLEEQRREARHRAEQARLAASRADAFALEGVGAARAAAPAGIGSRSIGQELRDPRALRRAFVLREVLAAPVGLR